MPGCATNSNILLQSILQNCLDIITVKSLDGRYIACNKAFLNLIEQDNEDDIIGKHTNDVMGPQNAKLIMDNFEKVLKTREPLSYTFNIKTPKVNKIVHQTATPIIENDVITRILCVARDVTHEENLKLKLVDKISQLNILFEHLPMLVYMRDANGKYITGSKYSKEFIETGIDRYVENAIIDKSYNDPIVKEEDNFVIQTKKMLVKEQKTISIDGDDLWYKICKVPIIGIDAKVTGTVTIAQNINSQKYLETQKELFLATLTHDLKNPVQAQLMSLNMVRKGAFGDLNNEQKEMLDMVIESTTYMQNMLKSILTTYKFDNGVITLEKELFDAEDLMHSCINEVTAFAQNKNVNIICNFDTKGTKLLADKQQLRRVVSNLLNNALNYSFEGSDLKLSIINNGQNMIFTFDNQSPVIPEHIRVQIFDKYVTGAKSFKLTGIGLGLYFCKKVVDAHNGMIYLDANGENNKFIFEIPLQDDLLNARIAW